MRSMSTDEGTCSKSETLSPQLTQQQLEQPQPQLQQQQQPPQPQQQQPLQSSQNNSRRSSKDQSLCAVSPASPPIKTVTSNADARRRREDKPLPTSQRQIVIGTSRDLSETANLRGSGSSSIPTGRSDAQPSNTRSREQHFVGKPSSFVEMADDTNEVYISMSASDVIKGAASPAKSAAHDVSKRKTSAIPTPAGTSSPRNKVHEERVPERRQLPVREVYRFF